MPARACSTRRSARLAATAVLVAVVGSGLVVTSMPAQADIEQQIQSAQARLDSLNEASEAAAERYNRARIQFTEAQQRAEIAGRALDEAQRKLDRREAAVEAFATQAYMNGGLGSLPLVMGGQEPMEFLDKMTALDAISRSQAQTLSDLAAAQHDQAAAQAAADAAAARQRTALDDAEREKATVQRNAAEAQQVLSDLREKQAELIREAREAAAREAARQRAAELARQQELAAAAAAAFARETVTATAPVPTRGHYSGNAVQIAIQVAKEQLGKPYVWAAAGPDSFDCSGLTMYAYGKAGIALSHYTGAQWHEGRHVSQSELQPGDLVFFGADLGHMGMYLGSGQFIHAPHTGDVVKISPLTGYYQDNYAGAVRVVG